MDTSSECSGAFRRQLKCPITKPCGDFCQYDFDSYHPIRSKLCTDATPASILSKVVNAYAQATSFIPSIGLWAVSIIAIIRRLRFTCPPHDILVSAKIFYGAQTIGTVPVGNNDENVISRYYFLCNWLHIFYICVVFKSPAQKTLKYLSTLLYQPPT